MYGHRTGANSYNREWAFVTREGRFVGFVHYHVDTSASPSRMYRVGGGICIVYLMCRVVGLGLLLIFCGFYHLYCRFFGSWVCVIYILGDGGS